MRRTWDPTIPVIITASVMVAGVLASTGGLVPGAWRATLSSNHATVRLEMRLSEHGSDMRITTDVPVTELAGFDAASLSRPDAPVKLAWTHDAGSFVIEGTGGRHPSGVVRFEPSSAFRNGWKEMGLEPLGEGDLFLMAMSGVRLSDVAKLKAAGVEDLDARGVIELARDSDAMRWVEEMEGRGAPVHLRDVFLLRNHGLDPNSFREYVAAGVAPDVRAIVRLHDRGVDAEYLAAVIKAGVGAADLPGIERLHDHGVDPEYVAGIRASGLPENGVEEIVRLHDQGIDADYVRGLMASRVAGITLEGIVRLHAHGVPVDYAHAVADFGPGDRAVEDAIRLHDNGVSTEFMRSRSSGASARPTTDATIRSWARGGTD
jgi:hypothetical protein